MAEVLAAIELLQVHTRSGRRKIMASVAAYLRKHLPSCARGTATQETAMNVAQDITIWFANEVREGRASLET